MYDHYTLDGINNTDVDFNSFVVQPSIDAIQEMKVQTGVYPAQYGYNATQVNVVTMSGTNHLSRHRFSISFGTTTLTHAGITITTDSVPPCAPV